MTEDRPSPESEPEKIRAGSRSTHRIVGVFAGFGIFVYSIVTALNVYMNLLGLPALRGRLVMTIPTDTALGLLGVIATVLVAFVASSWTSTQLPATAQSAYGLGRRLVLIDVTIATGGSSVFIGLAGALHGWGQDINVIVSVAVLGLSVALAYVAAEISEFIRRDREVHQRLQSIADRTRINRLRNARRCWKRRSHQAGSRRTRHSWQARLRQNLGCVIAAVLLQSAALLAFHGVRDLGLALAITVGCVIWSLVVAN